MAKPVRKKNVRGAGKVNPIMLRRVQKVKGCLVLCLPKPWCELRGFTEGLLMALHLGHDEIHIRPVAEE
jgi:hypothetical protein